MIYILKTMSTFKYHSNFNKITQIIYFYNETTQHKMLLDYTQIAFLHNIISVHYNFINIDFFS